MSKRIIIIFNLILVLSLCGCINSGTDGGFVGLFDEFTRQHYQQLDLSTEDMQFIFFEVEDPYSQMSLEEVIGGSFTKVDAYEALMEIKVEQPYRNNYKTRLFAIYDLNTSQLKGQVAGFADELDYQILKDHQDRYYLVITIANYITQTKYGEYLFYKINEDGFTKVTEMFDQDCSKEINDYWNQGKSLFYQYNIDDDTMVVYETIGFDDQDQLIYEEKLITKWNVNQGVFVRK